MHYMDFKTQAVAELFKSVRKLGEATVKLFNICKHNHCKKILQNLLSDIDYIYSAFGAFLADLGDNSDIIVSDNRYNSSFHFDFPHLILFFIIGTSRLNDIFHYMKRKRADGGSRGGNPERHIKISGKQQYDCYYSHTNGYEKEQRNIFLFKDLICEQI